MTFKSFVVESGLTQDDKELWVGILERLEADQVKVFEDFVNNDETKLRILTENLRAKEWTFRTGDEKALEEILEEEESIIKNF